MSEQESRTPLELQRSFCRKLEQLVGEPVIIRFNRNRSVFLSVVRRSGRLHLSVHECFLTAPNNVIESLARYVLRSSLSARRVLQDFFELWCETHGRPQRRSGVLRARGRTYDLHAIFEELNREYFCSALQVAITWGRSTNFRKNRTRIVFGNYDHHQRVIRIHPALDSSHVPEYFVRFVVYHEMLHAYLEPEKDADGRRRIHTPKFRKLERAFPHYEQAMAFEKEFWKIIRK